MPPLMFLFALLGISAISSQKGRNEAESSDDLSVLEPMPNKKDDSPIADDDRTPDLANFSPPSVATPTTSTSDGDLPSRDPGDYENVISGKTFKSTVNLDSDDSNTLFINCTFEDINGHGMTIGGGAENITILNCNFENIEKIGVLLRSSSGSDNVSIMSSTFENIGQHGIHAAQRSENDVDHTDLTIHDNRIHDTGMKGETNFHGIYVQTSGVVVSENEVTGNVGANGISIRSDGVVRDNYVNVDSGREYSGGIKYFSDHKTGESKKLIIEDNVVDGKNLYAGIQLDMVSNNKPGNLPQEDWVVNDFVIKGNTVNARNDYVVDREFENADWASIDIRENANHAVVSTSDLSLLPEVPFDENTIVEEEEEREFELFL